MHEHDHDLIMALAEGGLTPEAAAEAEAALAVCATCQADLAAQRLTVEVLRRVPQVSMTAHERDRLHATVKRELRLEEPDVASAPAVTRPRWRLLSGLAGAAAVLLALVLVAPALQFLAPGGNEDSATELVGQAAEGSATTTTSAARFTEEDTGVADYGEVFGTTSGQLPAADGGDEAPASTTTTLSTVPPVGSPLLARYAGVPSADDLRDIVIAAGGDPSLAQRNALTTAATSALLDTDAALRCSTFDAERRDRSLASFPIATFTEASGDGVMIAYVGDPLEATEVVAYDLDDCTQLDVSSP